MKKPIIKTIILLVFFLLLVSWHLKIIFLYFLFLAWRKFIPDYQENKKMINRTALAVFVLSFIVLFPDRTADKDDYIQSVYYDKKTGEELGEPFIPYMTNIIGEGEIMTAVSLGSYIVPGDFLKGSALGDVIRYNNSTYFFNNNFHNLYRECESEDTPPHNVPFQIMQDNGFYKDMSHYYLHMPDVENPEDCEVIVYCHGYTGNWVLYSHIFAKYTDAIIIAVETPSFSGYFSGRVMKEIVNKTIPHAFDRMGIPYKKPHIIGLSAGGSAINYAAANYPNTFKSYTILSASLRSYPRTNKKVHVIYGANDRSGGISSKIPKSKYVRHRIKGEDHSLIVARPDITFKLINEIIKE
jgi:pimeloyl-ACP methyl ester carboxylesterase